MAAWCGIQPRCSYNVNVVKYMFTRCSRGSRVLLSVVKWLSTAEHLMTVFTLQTKTQDYDTNSTLCQSARHCAYCNTRLCWYTEMQVWTCCCCLSVTDVSFLALEWFGPTVSVDICHLSTKIYYLKVLLWGLVLLIFFYFYSRHAFPNTHPKTMWHCIPILWPCSEN